MKIYSFMYQDFLQKWQKSVMETRDHLSNGVSLKNHMSRGNIFMYNRMKKVILSLGLLFTFSLTSVVAQDYISTYSGTFTLTPIVYTGDINNINTEIENQILTVGQSNILFSNISVYKEGESINIGFINVEFAPNGNISAPNIDSDAGDLTFSITSGNVSGNTINLTFRMADKATGGTIMDVIWAYTGTRQETGINEILSADEGAKIVGYYSVTGQELTKEPESGFYIVVYDNGRSKKIMKK